MEYRLLSLEAQLPDSPQFIPVRFENILPALRMRYKIEDPRTKFALEDLEEIIRNYSAIPSYEEGQSLTAYLELATDERRRRRLIEALMKQNLPAGWWFNASREGRGRKEQFDHLNARPPHWLVTDGQGQVHTDVHIEVSVAVGPSTPRSSLRVSLDCEPYPYPRGGRRLAGERLSAHTRFRTHLAPRLKRAVEAALQSGLFPGWRTNSRGRLNVIAPIRPPTDPTVGEFNKKLRAFADVVVPVVDEVIRAEVQ